MATVLDQTQKISVDDNETLQYLQKEKVPLNNMQIETIIEMQLSIEDLSNMNIDTDFVEFCNELKLSFAPKIKLKTAIIKLHKSKINAFSSQLDDMKLQLLISMGFNEDNAKRALTNNDNDINKAVNALKSLN
eukprot:227955_1